MKKSLLLTAALAFAVAASAQNRKPEMVKNVLPVNNTVRLTLHNPAQAQMKKTAATGTFYKRPEGAYYKSFSLEGYGYYQTMIDIAPFTEVTFENQSTETTGAWHINYYNSDNSLAQSFDISEYATDGSLVWTQAPMEKYATPTLVNAADSFAIGENNLYKLYYGRMAYSGFLCTDSISTHKVADDHAGQVEDGQVYGITYGWGLLDNDNMFGTGTLTYNADTTYVCYACEQVFDKPMSPLYVENFFVDGLSITGTPIAEGDTLKCYIYDVAENGKTHGSNIIDVLYATAADTLDFKSTSTRNSKTVYNGTIIFTKRSKDAFGTEAVEPIVLTDKFCVVLTGFDKNIDFSASGLLVDENYDNTIVPARNFLYNPKDETDYTSFRYKSTVAMSLGFTGMYDAVSVPDLYFSNQPEDVKFNVLRVSADGQTVTTDGQESGSDWDMGFAMVGTAIPFFDSDDNANYSVEVETSDGDDTWVDWAIDNSYYSNMETNFYGMNFLKPQCSALGEGVTGRWAVATISGKGVTGENKIYVLQGDATLADAQAAGINFIEKNAATKSTGLYNLAGQKVSKAEKGIFIQNGKKFIAK